MFYEVKAIRKETREEHKLLGWWESDKKMILDLNRRGYRVVEWTKR